MNTTSFSTALCRHRFSAFLVEGDDCASNARLLPVVAMQTSSPSPNSQLLTMGVNVPIANNGG